MRINKNKIYAVLTGDVIASRRLSKLRRRDLHTAMLKGSRHLRTAFGSAIPADLELFRGDGWQLLLSKPELCLRLTLFYRATLIALMGSHSFDIRTAIALGTIDFVPGTRVTEGDGEAFRTSGKVLEAMAKGEAMRFRFQRSAEEETLDVVVRLIDHLAMGWSDKQALAITGALRGLKQTEIAESLWESPISQQAVAQHLNRGSWGGIETGLDYFEKSVAEQIEKIQPK